MFDVGFRHTSMAAARIITTGLRRVSKRTARRRVAAPRKQGAPNSVLS
jgi:hypothetical protein